jgi:hypothetical protein
MEEWRLIDKAKISAISSGAAASGRNIVRGGGGGGDGQKSMLTYCETCFLLTAAN